MTEYRADAKKLYTSLNEIQRLSNILSKVFIALALASCIFLIFLSFSIISTKPDYLSIAKVSPGFLFNVISILVLFFIADIFRSISCGNSPFNEITVRRIRIISAFILLGALVDTLVSSSSVSFISYDNTLGLGYTSHNFTDNPGGIFINVRAILCAVTGWSFSLIFKYGTLLQHETEEML